MKYFMGIDIGTFESKGLLMNENGEIVIVQSTPHIMQTPHPGYAEHDAEETWWHDFCKLSNGLIAESGIDPNDIKGVGCSAIGPCCLPVDKDCRPLRKAILYGVDVRAKKQIEDLNRELGEDYVLQKYGNPITSQSIGPKILWIKENEPEVYEKADKFITASTYLVAKLTGEYVIDNYTAAYFTPMYDLDNCDWDYENLDRFCRPDQLAKCMWTDEIAGVVTAKAAAETGLAEGTPVTAGTADASADAVGVGVFHPGDLLAMFGSSLYMIHVVPKLTTDKRYWAGPYLFKGTYMVASGMSTTGTLTRWFRDELAPDFVRKQEEEGINAYTLLKDSIEDINPGSDGLIVLPYLSGERTPINDPAAKGMIFGLTLQHTRAHLYQACLESIAYGIEQHLRGYAEIGMQTNRIIAVGGGTKAPKWMQIVSDVTGQKLMLGGVYGAAFGDAMLAALGTGTFASVDEMERVVKFNGDISPDKEKKEFYASYVDKYIALYERTKDIMHSM
ncbi:MAG: FGGY-family carbohydrate kinase [Clostridia bacterium]|nr:FGGY-family carbohydrate kinase [Clostridia bacterium]